MLDEMVQEALVVVIKLNLDVSCASAGAMGKVKEVGVEGLL